MPIEDGRSPPASSLQDYGRIAKGFTLQGCVFGDIPHTDPPYVDSVEIGKVLTETQ